MEGEEKEQNTLREEVESHHGAEGLTDPRARWVLRLTQYGDEKERNERIIEIKIQTKKEEQKERKQKTQKPGIASLG